MNFDKYNPLSKAVQQYVDSRDSAPITCGIDVHVDGSVVYPPWMSSSQVIRLIEYLRKNQEKGIILYEKGGAVGLRFRPGLNAEDLKNGRGKIASNTYDLLCEAKDDLTQMIARGIEVPLLARFAAPHKTSTPSRTVKAGNKAKPSAGPP